MRTSPRLRNFLLGSSLLVAVNSAHAVDFTWDGGGADANWGTAANWDATPTFSTSNGLIFNAVGATQLTNYIGAARSINTLTFNADSDVEIQLYTTLNGTTSASLTLGGTTPTITVQAGNHTIKGDTTSGTVGTLILSPATGLNIAADSSLDLNTRIRASASSNNFTKIGAGTLILSANSGGTNSWNFNTAATGFTVSEGILRLNATGAVGNSGNKYVISSGAALELTGGFSQNLASGTITLNGTGIGNTGAIRNISGDNSINPAASSTGTIILNTASSIGVDAGTLTIGKGISGSNSLTKVGAGTLVLGNSAAINNNTYSGVTTVDAGTLRFAIQGALYNANTANWTATNLNVKSGATLAFNVGGTNEFTTGNVTTLLTNLAASSSGTNGMNAGSNLGFDTTNAGGTFTIADVIADTTGISGGARGLTKLGTGTLELTNTNTYTGTTTVSAGTLTLGHVTDTLTGAVNVNGGILDLGTNTDTVGAVTLTSGSITGSGTGKLTGTGSDYDVRSGTISAKLGGTVGLTKTTGGTVTISSDNSTGGYTGATTVSDGKLIVDGDISTSTITTVQTGATIGGSGTVGNLTIDSGGTIDLTGATLGLNSTGILTLSGGDLNLGNLTFQDLVGWDWENAAVGTYKLINGTFDITWGSTAYLNEGSAYDFNNGYGGYFTQGSLNAVIFAVPEPNVAALLGGLGVLLLLRRR